ncbi:FtsW/RodA/SpoVE family cell cycle protein [Synechocystis sp. PCC 7509]|uniref:FtsW/RodA/SpoVE family cell cycle protein n=1 Tax=Synechocystis sp. PCC 7509 TaxID=927677 RepID=UPI0002ACC532|nr:FtsW/RodA/SpoVE family cell cycle protein [Synechocystis sp. PCC 7509]
MELRQLIPVFDTSTSKWASLARLLRWLTLLWVFIGLAILFSASYPVGEAELGDGLYYFKRQIIAIIIGLVVFNWVIHSPLRRILGMAHWFVFLFMALIFATLIPGIGTNSLGAVRTIAIGSFQLQPSELIKPFLVLQGARVFGQWHKLKWQSRLIWLSIFALILGGILLQPNLSTTALCGMALWLVALAAGLPYSYLTMTALSGVGMAAISISLRDYQRRRVMSFLNPWADALNNGYQLVQSLLAIGSGGTWGTGYGLSQQKLFYLPIQHTDFIFAVFAEEFGFVGCLLFLLLLVVYSAIALLVAFKATNPVHRLVAIGAMIFLVGQSLLNIGVASGALPTTGLPLPLVSYGGNSIIASLLIAGLLIRVARESSEGQVVSLPQRRGDRF